MSRKFHRGLIVGKFCPLHLGHESVIRRAIELCGEVCVISYTNPEFPGCEPALRRDWLAKRFPEVRSLVLDDSSGVNVPPNDADDRTHRRFVGALCRDVLRVTVDAVFTSESYGDGFAAELTRFFRDEDPSCPEVVHISVDEARHALPVSGTLLREDIHKHRDFLAPEVYASFVQRIALLGGESSGKTTLAAALAGRFETVWAPEFGRELWEQRAGKLVAEDMPEIARAQLAREAAATRTAHRYVFCDSTPLTTLFYSVEMFGISPDGLADMASTKYDRTILCAPDFPFVQDGTRRDAAFREKQHRWYLSELERRGIPFLLAAGTLDERVRTVSDYLLAGARTSPV